MVLREHVAKVIARELGGVSVFDGKDRVVYHLIHWSLG